MTNTSKLQREWFERYQIAKATRKVSRGIVAREIGR
jgi:hypothetical protein